MINYITHEIFIEEANNAYNRAPAHSVVGFERKSDGEYNSYAKNLVESEDKN